MSQYWFKPKTYGYGATPSGWKGWAAVAIYAVRFAQPRFTLVHAGALGSLIGLLALTRTFELMAVLVGNESALNADALARAQRAEQVMIERYAYTRESARELVGALVGARYR